MPDPEAIGNILPRVMDDLNERRLSFRDWFAAQNIQPPTTPPPAYLRREQESDKVFQPPAEPPPGPLFEVPWE